MTKDWLAGLDPRRRVRAEEMIEALEDLGAGDAEELVRRDFTEDAPHVATHLLVHDLWSEVNGWRDDSEEWISSFIESCEKDPEGSFAEAGAALERMIGAGVDPGDIGRVARMVAYKSMFHFAYVIAEGSEAEGYEELPGWALVELDEKFVATGRHLRGLHEKFLEGKPAEDPERAK